MKITLDISEQNESTSFPWWFIVNPHFGTTSNPENVASCVTGPFFSREEAENELKYRSYDYSKKAIVWCGSGYHTNSYRKAIQNGESK